jgi:small subunit ribosomal protein S5
MSEARKVDRSAGNHNRRRRDVGNAPRADRDDLSEKVVYVNRCAKVVMGGRRFSFSALVVVGNQKGRVGVGYGKAKEVSDAIKKGTDRAKKNLTPFPMNDTTIPHAAIGIFDGGRVLLRPAAPGTGVIAGGGVRAVLEVLGVKDVLTKSMGSNNQLAVVHATIDALKKMRTRESVKQMRMAAADDLQCF